MKRIMIVDDEVLIRVGIKSMLNWEDYGYTIAGDASNGLEALNKMEQCRPDIVLTDLMMSTMDGFELIERCSREYPNIKFIVLSNYNDFDNVKRAMKLGACDYVFKLTIAAKELLQILDEVSKSIHEQMRQGEQEDASSRIVIKHLSEIKTKLMKQALGANYILKTSLEEEFRRLPLQSDFTVPYITLYIRFDNFFIAHKKGDFSDLDLFKFSVENVISEVFNKNHPSEVYIVDISHVIIIINRNQGESWDEFTSILTNNFAFLSQNIKQYFGLDISGSMSQEAAGLEKLPECYAQNKEILEQNYVSNEDSLQRYNKNYLKNDIRLPEDLKIESTESALAHQDFYKIIEYVDRLLQYLGGQKQYTAEAIRSILLQLYYKVKYYLLVEKIDIDNLRDSGGLNLSEAIQSYNRYKYLSKSILELFHLYKRMYEEKNSIRCRNEIERIKSFVIEHLQEEITVQKASGLLNMSESYFLHLFKKEVGTSFIDYVNKIRVDHAIRLLKDTDYRIAEISELVGIENPNYFSVLFKKRTGKTPNEYRRRT